MPVIGDPFFPARKTFFLHLIGVFVFGFTLVYVFYAGLPVDFNHDYVAYYLRSIKEIQISDLFKMTIHPLTPAWFYPEHDRMEDVRPLSNLLFQLVHHRIPYSMIPFQILCAAGHGILAMLFFLIIYYATRSALWGWLGVLLYASFPSNFLIMSSTVPATLEYFVSVLSVLALIGFFLLTSGRLKKGVTFFAGVFSWVILIWTAIKWRSSEKILPFVCLAFLLLRFRFIITKIGHVRFITLFVMIMATAPLIVPVSAFKKLAPHSSNALKPAETAPSTDKDKEAFSFHLENSIQRTFYVPGGEFPFTTVYRNAYPRSFTENLGFFLGWLFWLSFPFVLFRSIRRGGEYEQLFWLNSIWFGLIIAGFASGMSVMDVRFLNLAYVPFVPLFFIVSGHLQTQVHWITKRKAFFGLFLAAILIYTIAANFIFLTKQVAHFGGMQDVLVRAERDVFEDVHGHAPEGAELYTGHQKFESENVIIDWYDYPDNWFEKAVQMLGERKKLYVYARDSKAKRLSPFEDAKYRIALWKRYQFYDAKPPVFDLFKFLSEVKGALGHPMKRREVLVYKIQDV